MKTQIDIITGFLGAGKTTFINGLLASDLLSGERIVVIQCESGESELCIDSANTGKVHIERVDSENLINAAYIENIIARHNPDRIVIEHNSMSKLESLLDAADDRRLRNTGSINTIIHLTDSSTFSIFMNNMAPILTEQISNSDLIVINNIEMISRHKINGITKALAAINKEARIISISSPEECKLAVDHGSVYEEKKKIVLKTSDMLLLLLFFLVTGYFIYTVLRAVKQTNMDFSLLETFNTVFLSILIQAFPFILFGVLISSIIQVFISEEMIVRLFPRNGIAAFCVAIFSGVLLPVCDCAIIPVAGRLARKGVPLPVAVTFMLAAPIVNPIVIASTIYAFPGQLSVVYFRTLLGIAIAVAVGFTFIIFPEKKSIFRNAAGNFQCKCGYCSREYENARGFTDKLNNIFMHAASEFFEVGKFLIIGAFLSTVMQTILPKDILAGFAGGNALSLLVMMLSAFVFSICSTSDAFIARTFTGQFPLSSVMGFLVLGPMIDIKNLFMLLGNFNKKFAIKLVAAIFGISFALLYILGPILF